MGSLKKYACLIGAQKAGTTSLFYYLATHPQIHTIHWKEGRYFLNDVPPKADQRRFDRLLAGCSDDQTIFETSTYYTKYPEYDGVPQRIQKRYPSAKFIYLVRDPIARIWSQYSHYLAKDWERLPFAQAIRENSTYLDYSRYYLQLSRYLDCFPQERMLVLIFEEFIADRAGTLRKIFKFLDLDESFVPPNLDVTYNSGSVKLGMSPAKRLLFAMPGFRHLPWRIRNWAKFSLGKPLPTKEEEQFESQRAWLEGELREDLDQFLAWLGRDVPLWKSLGSRDSAEQNSSCSV